MRVNSSIHRFIDSWMLAVGLAGWLVGLLAGWLAGSLVGSLARWLADWLAGWLAGPLVGWWVGWLVGWFVCGLIDCLAGWLATGCRLLTRKREAGLRKDVIRSSLDEFDGCVVRVCKFCAYTKLSLNPTSY